MNIVGICGYARSGKDTLFDSIKRIHPDKDVIRIAFGDGVKMELKELLLEQFGIDAWTEDDDEKKLIRPIMVAYGKAKRAVDTDYWLTKGIKQIDFCAKNTVFVFTDVRYQNELDELKKLGAKLIYIHKLGNEPANDEELLKVTPLKEQCDFNYSLLNFNASDCFFDKQLQLCDTIDETVRGSNLLGTNTIEPDKQ